jgi:5-methyltetrahydrofolate--homocysteine methyltransferase
MTPEEFKTRLDAGPMLLDGGLGTLLMSMGLQPGEAPERWVLDHPDLVTAAHRRYVDAGSDVVHTVTFGGTPTKLAASGLEGTCDEVNRGAVALAREAASDSVLVAGDVGPTGRFFPPTGDATTEEMLADFRAQIEVLARSGVDLISIETMYDVREAIAAVRVARATGLAVMCSMTFEPRKRGTFTFMGDALGPSLQALVAEGATAVGLNCSVTSETMIAMVEQARKALPDIPIVAQPNAGQPITTPDGIHYDADPESFAGDVMAMVRAGARVVGGCCGTDDRFIRAARAQLLAYGEARG